MALDKQIQIYAVDTATFYSNSEKRLHMINQKVKSEKNVLISGTSKNAKRKVVGRDKVKESLGKFGIDEDALKSVKDGEYDLSVFEDADKIRSLCDEYFKYEDMIAIKNRQAKEAKDKLLELLSNKVDQNVLTDGKDHIRELREQDVSDKNIISVFDSYFTRTIGAKQNELCEDFMVIQVFYFDVIKDLIHFGFVYKGEKYVYFTSSAGQIRTKKCVFVKESVWKKHEKALMCGLTIDKINEMGGNNPNKHLAYLALANSATDVWDDFDIDKSIVIDDFETDVFGTYDLVDETDYSVKRQTGHVPIPHTDGAGMMLPSMGKNRMVRLPWVKGLLGAFPFDKFIEEHGCSPVIKDIYGKEHDVIAEGIQVIFTKSQFKMYKYYSSWDEYKDKYKKHGCTAGYTNLEEDRIPDATINYQMLQSLVDVTDEEIACIAKTSVDNLSNMCSSVDNIKELFGVTPYNSNKTPFQKAIELHPNLLNDDYIKSYIRDIKDSMVKRSKSGKLNVDGKYTFILPDFYAACEYWFLGDENPNGLLEDGEVFCWLFRRDDKLDCLRSPHLFNEHAVRKNVACKTYGERQQEVHRWFCTKAVYTSCHDMISRVLQFDVDGDKSLVVADKTLIEVAERNIEKFDIVPLYYNMSKAKPVILNNENIYNGLHAAFVGGNIGIYSNNISKIWNSDKFAKGNDDDKKDAIDTIKLFCMENNFVIDYAKTLYKPTRTKEANEKMSEFTKLLLPHFFKYAKDKSDEQVDPANDSFVNKLDSLVKNPKMYFKRLGLGEIDYKVMMRVEDIDIDEENPVVAEYLRLNKDKNITVDMLLGFNKTKRTAADMRKLGKRSVLINSIKESLSSLGYSDEDIVDILVKYLYGVKKSGNKSALWLCYGDIILDNMENKLLYQTKVVECIDCGKWIAIPIDDQRTCRCTLCQKDYEKELKRDWWRESHGGFTDIRKAISMYHDDELIGEFDSVEECCEYIKESLNLKTKVRTIRSKIDASILYCKSYRGFTFVKN